MTIRLIVMELGRFIRLALRRKRSPVLLHYCTAEQPANSLPYCSTHTKQIWSVRQTKFIPFSLQTNLAHKCGATEVMPPLISNKKG